MITDADVVAAVQLACDANNISELFPLIQIEWNSRFTRRMGDGVLYRGPDGKPYKARIRLSIPLFQRATESEQLNTVYHEACHIITFAKFGRVQAHGWQWKSCMLRCGETPKRCHNVDRSGLLRRTQYYTAVCNCENGLQISKIIYNRIKQGVKYRCRTCKAQLVV